MSSFVHSGRDWTVKNADNSIIKYQTNIPKWWSRIIMNENTIINTCQVLELFLLSWDYRSQACERGQTTVSVRGECQLLLEIGYCVNCPKCTGMGGSLFDLSLSHAMLPFSTLGLVLSLLFVFFSDEGLIAFRL